jgi:hypothetical protein
MKDAARQQFRWAPHVSGAANIKPKDFEPSIEVEAENEYAAWALLRESDSALAVGDVLENAENAGGQLRICKYVGFEDARWFIPAPVTTPVPDPVPGPVTIPPAAQSAQA